MGEVMETFDVSVIQSTNQVQGTPAFQSDSVAQFFERAVNSEVPKTLLTGLETLREQLETMDLSALDGSGLEQKVGDNLLMLEEAFPQYFSRNPHHIELNFVFNVLEKLDFIAVEHKGFANDYGIMDARMDRASYVKVAMPSNFEVLKTLLMPSLNKILTKASSNQMKTSYLSGPVGASHRNNSLEQELYNLRRALESADDDPSIANNEGLQSIIGEAVSELLYKHKREPGNEEIGSLVNGFEKMGLVEYVRFLKDKLPSAHRLSEAIQSETGRSILENQVMPILDRY